MNILDACKDRALFAPWFDKGDWSAWFAFLAAVFGLPMDSDQRRIFESCTGGRSAPESAVREAYLVIGRRGGKSFITALIAVYLAAFHDYRQHLQPGERGTVLILAADRKQARVIFRYCRALIAEVPMLAEQLERETTEGLELSTGVNIEIATASFRATRGYAVVAALLDEVAFWGIDGERDAGEIINAISPGMATIPNSMLFALSSPYSKQGALFEAYREHYGQDTADVIVWQADTRTMNPTVPERIITRAYEKDPASAAAEYGGQFRDDLEQFISREQIDRCTRDEPVELPALRDNRYVAFVDPAGGSGQDAMTLAIAHQEGEQVVVDVAREMRPPFSPAEAVEQFAETIHEYGCRSVIGDRYGGEWCREPFRKAGIDYEIADRPRTDLYRDTLPLLNAGNLELPPMDKLARQFSALQRQKGRSGKDMIDHPRGGHDDLSNAVAGAAVAASKRSKPGIYGLIQW